MMILSLSEPEVLVLKISLLNRWQNTESQPAKELLARVVDLQTLSDTPAGLASAVHYSAWMYGED